MHQLQFHVSGVCIIHDDENRLLLQPPPWLLHPYPRKTNAHRTPYAFMAVLLGYTLPCSVTQVNAQRTLLLCIFLKVVAELDRSLHNPLAPNTLESRVYLCSSRVNTVAEAREVSEVVSATTERLAALSDFVGPFAYRLACAGGGGARRQSPRNIGEVSNCSRPKEEDCGTSSEEGYCDNGDVGSGEKLLHLLQKWDVRHRVLIVTRINGGFVMAELMGVRRYKFHHISELDVK